MRLTDKQRRFCEEYVVDWNATRAAIAAGYSKKTARQIATQNLSKLYIREHIEDIQKDLSKLTGVTATRNILELKKIAYSSIASFKNDWMTEKEFDNLTEEQLACISDIQYQTKTTGETTETIVKFKIHDKQKAIEILNKMLGFNDSDKLDITTNGKDIQEPIWKVVNNK